MSECVLTATLRLVDATRPAIFTIHAVSAPGSVLYAAASDMRLLLLELLLTDETDVAGSGSARS